MHAYRDAIRRTAGAYVLYPGNPADGNKQYQGFHEVLPGLGAFAVRPDSNGKSIGMEAVSDFLDTVIQHLANRTTMRERVTYHVAESYAEEEGIVTHGSISLPESDMFGRDHRALPPAEEMVLYLVRDTMHTRAARDAHGFAYVRWGIVRLNAVHPNPRSQLPSAHSQR